MPLDTPVGKPSRQDIANAGKRRAVHGGEINHLGHPLAPASSPLDLVFEFGEGIRRDQ